MKQVAWIYTMLIGFAVVFATVSVLIFLFGARPELVSKKLKFGSMIIAFNVMLAGCYSVNEAKEVPSCYGVTAPPATDDGRLTGTDSVGTPLDTDVECYVAPETPTDTGDSYIDTDIECYDAPDYPTDSETGVDAGVGDAGTGDTETGDTEEWQTDLGCYVIV